ncbi:glycosyltransferase 87 family protein [Kitasatospora sp. NPDC057198]|uniref:glycosyltransferase 87 family protein n=1 Tax=Kitasatospora sp. NPDC057198 TaxID=3346046 RepID=UPI00363E10B5
MRALTEVADPPGPGLRSERAAHPVRTALLGYLGARAVGVLLLAWWGSHRGVGGLYRLSSLWDAYWYQQIAAHGYAGTRPVPGPYGPYEPYAFFPAYPLLVRAAGLVLPLNYAALAVAWAASLAAAWGIHAVAARLYGDRAGVVAAVLWGVLPYAVVESAAYSEALFTAFAAWTVHAALRRRWVWAGLLCTCAGLTRPTGLTLALAVGAAALLELVRRRDPRALLGAVLAPLGCVGFIAWVGHRKGRWDGYFRVQDAWQSHFDFGRSTFASLRRMLVTADTVWLVDVVTACTLLAAVVLLVLSAIQRQPPVLLLYSAGMLLLALGDAAYFNSRARFLLPAFGLLYPLATALARTRTRSATVLLLVAAALVSAAYGGYVAFVYPDAP